VHIDPAHTDSADIYRILIGSVVPRPVAFVSTVSADGVGNLAPFSFFNAVSSNPPCLILGISRKGDGSGDKKDTLRNIEATGEFVVNTSSEWLVEPMVHCGAAYPYGVDEMQKVGLTPIPSTHVRPPRIKESAVQFECKLHSAIDLGGGTPGSTTLVVGRIVMLHIFDEAYNDGRVDSAMLKPVGRLGGIGYALLQDPFNIPVPALNRA